MSTVKYISSVLCEAYGWLVEEVGFNFSDSLIKFKYNKYIMSICVEEYM